MMNGDETDSEAVPKPWGDKEDPDSVLSALIKSSQRKETETERTWRDPRRHGHSEFEE